MVRLRNHHLDEVLAGILQRAIDFSILGRANVAVEIAPQKEDRCVDVDPLSSNLANLRSERSFRRTRTLPLDWHGRPRAAVDGRDFVLPEDVRALAVPVLAHRIMLDTKAKYGGVLNDNIVEDALDHVSVPR